MKAKVRKNPVILGDGVLWTIFVALTLASALAVYSSIGLYAVTSNATTPERMMLKHLGLVALSYAAVIVITHIRYGTFKVVSLVVYFASLILSAVAVSANTRWLMGIQPSEVLKLATIMVLAWYVYERQDRLQTPKVMWTCFAIIIISSAAIFGMNFSSAALLYVACVFMLLFVGVDIKWWSKLFMWSLLIGLGLLLAFYLWGDSMEVFRSSTWGSRINRWLHPTDELTQENMARMAIARGGLTGSGVGSTIHSRLMTEAHNDFIFAIIIEEWGSIAAMLLFTLYCWFFRRCTIIAGRCREMYGAALVSGIGILIFLQALVNMGVAVGLLPVTGQTLPFVSYGGTAYLVMGCGFGIIQKVAAKNKRIEKKEKLKKIENETEGITAGA